MNRLYCGDYIDIVKQMPDSSVDMILTDPPYGIGYKSSAQRINRRNGGAEVVRLDDFFREIEGDNDDRFIWMYPLYRVLRKGGAAYIFCHWSKWYRLERIARSVGFTIKNMLVVNKSNHGMGDIKGGYAPKHELILFATKGRHLLNNVEVGRGKDVIEGKVLYSGARRWHPNEKPIVWVLDLIKRSCPVNGVIFDPFMGSGSIGVSAKKLDRQFIGVEIDEHYYNIAVRRISNENNI